MSWTDRTTVQLSDSTESNGISKRHSPMTKAQKNSRRVITRSHAAPRPCTLNTCGTGSANQDKRKRQREEDDDGHEDMVQVKLESIRPQKGLKAVATPASTSSTYTNRTIDFKKAKLGSPRKSADKKEASVSDTQDVCGLCNDAGHKSAECEL
ncbi:hypothetical protein EMPS_03794 [Entomortierella parvispora]|uniref:Uncharacterized protein n=1 Tax=Entomortierella parvispora TaxID=205924 RepID=A0A9P3H790_9FUNG|nr:hypothetical protein EMPS_03794 [Entomortierella parvispora]